MLTFKRVHNTGTEAVLDQYAEGWRIQINLREVNHNPMTIVGYMEPTVERAKTLADKEILSHGHVCNNFCKSWREC